ncbi:hypothetical protein SUGI_0791620 [Cryptomeria japonica]|uniref:thaumatin-like protein 1 n=1 Tax=Cryptomeria japonica TaxID=3369 RepID=UPI00241485A3|nr:thaumatin-like protein 1 [Cryptomeria japonica]GLJ38843.1 hypothetical protein SUGI_0791620 [Cryptomeria japonica]
MKIIKKLILIVLLAVVKETWAASFTVLNNCGYTVWPGFLSNAGITPLTTTGFELQPGTTRVVSTPARWSGRMWGRTGCNFGADGKGNCTTGDCGGQLQCNGAGAIPPASLAEFSLDPAGLDFYDVSLVDGYNLPMLVVATGGTGACLATGCIVDINLNCPKELQLDDGGLTNGGGNVLACKSACEVFGSPQYCCSGAYANPNTCKPSTYSQLFKSACPRAYSYAFDDKTSTFTCAGADYAVTFCPTVAMASQKSSNSTPVATSPTVPVGASNVEGDSNTIFGASEATSAASSSVHTWTAFLICCASLLTSILLTQRV